MIGTLLIFTIPIVYFLITYILIRLISKWLNKTNPNIRILILSFFYSLLWGIGIAGSGAEPGFGLPAPNIIAIILMINDGYFYGAITGFIFVALWWIVIFLFMLFRYLHKKKRGIPILKNGAQFNAKEEN